MFRRFSFMAFLISLLAIPAYAQSTNGLVTGVITDASGAVIPGAQIRVDNQGTALSRTAKSDSQGIYVFPQLPPGTYNVSVGMQGFATIDRKNVQLYVNQSVTLDFALSVSGTTQTVTVTGTPPALNTTSSTLGDVIDHDVTVELPLNGRQFTQLTLLTPGAVPQQAAQQTNNLISLGEGGIVPSVDGQRPRENNFTMDGVLNNYIFANTWAVSPPPDALQEFNVQSHITDAQFAISTGANINIVSRSGTNTFHGSVWEFFRNQDLDANTYPATSLLPYRQNQYGLYLGGPVVLPHLNGKNHTWFSGYWEGFRSNLSQATYATTLTPAMVNGDFSALLGAQVGTDDLGRPEYANEIYDPATTRTDPINPKAIIRDPFNYNGHLNVIPPGDINPDAPLILQKYYPAPNIANAAPNASNVSFSANTITSSDQMGARFDHRFNNNDTIFGRYNRDNINALRPEALPTQSLTATEYAQSYAVGYTHLFGLSSILSLHVGYLNTYLARSDTPAGSAFVNSLNFAQSNPVHNGLSFGPQVSFSNGYSAMNQAITQNGPQENTDYHVDYTKIVGSHTFGAGGMYYHIRSFSDGRSFSLGFTQNATSQAAATSTTGSGPASFLLGLPNSYTATLGDTSGDLTANWYGGYADDQWQVTKRLAITAGIRWDYVTPPNYHKIVSALNPLTGQFLITGAVPPAYPSATASSGFFHSQFNGFEPRFGVTYAASKLTVIHTAFAMLDDHNNSFVQEDQALRLSWPSAVQATVTSLNLGLPTVFMNQLPPQSSFLASAPFYIGYGANPDSKIPYSMEYNVGIEQQLPYSMTLSTDYVGSLTRHLDLAPIANTAQIPGPGTLASRGQPFPQYGGGTFYFVTNEGPASYNALQVKLKKEMSSGLLFLASYTWSKSLDIMSDAYASPPQNIYNLRADWGPSDFNRKQLLMLSGVYALPVGRGTHYLPNSNRAVEAFAGGWNIGAIMSFISGQPFNATAGGDVANVGGGTQRAEEIGNPYSGAGFTQSPHQWINKAAFATPTQYTFGNEGRNDLVGPDYQDIDFVASKNFSLPEHTVLQFRSEFFNFLNRTNYANPTASVQSGSFAQSLSTNGTGRIIQFALKLSF